jgi:integrase
VPLGLWNVVLSQADALPLERRRTGHPLFGPEFPTNDVGVYTRFTWRTVWDQAVRDSRQNFRTKDLRAYAATALVDAGATLLEARDLLGHARADTTERFYTQARDSRQSDPKRMAIRLKGTLNVPSRLDALYAAWVKALGDPFDADVREAVLSRE